MTLEEGLGPPYRKLSCGHFRRSKSIGISVIAVVSASTLLLGGCSSSGSSQAATPPATTHATTLRYYYVTTALNFYAPNGQSVSAPAVGDYIDNTTNGFSGDHTHHSNSLSTTAHLACTITSLTGGIFGLCDLQGAIGNSMVLGQHFTANFATSTRVLPITGGTGQYEGVHGTATITLIGNTNNADVVTTISK
jgi:hypothetical protein